LNSPSLRLVIGLLVLDSRRRYHASHGERAAGVRAFRRLLSESDTNSDDQQLALPGQQINIFHYFKKKMKNDEHIRIMTSNVTVHHFSLFLIFVIYFYHYFHHYFSHYFFHFFTYNSCFHFSFHYFSVIFINFPLFSIIFYYSHYLLLFFLLSFGLFFYYFHYFSDFFQDEPVRVIICSICPAPPPPSRGTEGGKTSWGRAAVGRGGERVTV
jgi:hypothetical protein